MKYNPKLTATDEYYFSKFIRNMAARKYSESSLRSYTTHLKAIKESLNKRNLSLSDLSPAVMEEVTEDWKEVAKNTHNMRVTTISNLFEYLKSIEKADKNPVSSHNYLRVEKYQKQPPTDKEVEKIVKETRKYSPEIEFGIALMTYAGLRVSELENIVFSSLTDNENYTSLMIHAKKYEKTRIVIIYNEYARNLIKRQLEINKLLDCSIVFPSRNYFNMILRKIGKKSLL